MQFPILLPTLLAALAPGPAPGPAPAAAPVPGASPAAESIRLPRDPRISPDGSAIAFTWAGDVWTAPSQGGAARRITVHAADDGRPCFSPDGRTLYFESNRSGRTQIWATDVESGAEPRQITFDSHGKTLQHATADGTGLVVRRDTDRGWHYSESNRLFLLDLDGEAPPRRLFDAGVMDGALSPDGDRALFVRGRSAWNRKGYSGAQAAQLWLADLTGETVTYERLDRDAERFQNVAAMDPVWASDGRSAFFLSDPEGVFDVFRIDLESRAVERVTDVAKDGSDDGVAFLSVTADGRTLLYRRGFDLVRYDVRKGEAKPIELHAASDAVASALERVRAERADEVAFTPDGKQMAYVAGNDVWVMDRILAEPRRITEGEHLESSLEFSADGQTLFFVTDAGGESDIWAAKLSDDAKGIWWLPDSAVELVQVTNDRPVEGSLTRSPNGSHIAFIKGTDVFVMDSDGTDHRRVVETWSAPEFDWSPDGRWLTFATQDDDYNSDIYVVPLDGTREPFNLSRHPDNDGDPKWSPDGSRIAWVGRRDGEEADIHWVDLTNEANEATERDEKLEKALKAMEPKKGSKRGEEAKTDDNKDDEAKGGGAEAGEPKKDDDAVRIDFDGIGDRVQRYRNGESFERRLIWFDGGEKLGFEGSVDGKNGFYAIEFPRPRKAEGIADSALGGIEWLPEAKEFVGHASGIPASMSNKGKTETYKFEVRTVLDWRVIRQAAFDQAWRAMRDRFYDEAYNNKNWETIRAKYRPVAAQCLGAEEFSQLCNMMLGELNASHMGHRRGTDPLPSFDAQNDWSPTTMHLGVRFDRAAGGPGLLVESVIPGGPAARERSRIEAGERILRIDGTNIGPETDLDPLLTLDDVRDLRLAVKGADGGAEREVVLRPVTSVRSLLYPEWVENTRQRVEELSEGRLGYLHIQGMNFGSLRQMEQDIYDAGVGKDGLLIDVRFNGGGSTTDHVLTALTQPVHAVTRSRGSGVGYPQDRKVYASWSKPIALLCNEHSFSNAEILSHAIKQIGRGRLVGMRTAGGVISTGSQGLLDRSSIRMPTRGWYLVSTGEDMELNGAEPDIALWNAPDWASPGGEDQQLTKAVEALLEDVAAEEAKGKVKLVPASVKGRK